MTVPFGTVIFHRKELLNAKPPFETLRDPTVRDAFDQELLALLSSWEYVVVSVCLDKKKHKDTYTRWRYDPYHYCLAVLLERFVFFLDRTNGTGDVMAESRGGKEDRRLKASFRRLWENGTEFVAPERFQTVLTSRELKVKMKANNIAGLQIADLLAHPSRNEILERENLIIRKSRPFADSVVGVLQQKYDQHGGRVFGRKFL